jgi:molybdate transport system permease protein
VTRSAHGSREPGAVAEPVARRARREARHGTAPWPVVVLAGVAVLLLALPLLGLVQRAPWSALGDELRAPAVRTALRLSLVCSVTATALALVLGVPLAWVLARSEFRGRRLLRALVTLPVVIPPVVGGVALLQAFGRRGLLGQALDDWFGIRLAFTTTGAVMAETFVALPFLVLAVEGALRSSDPRFEDAAATLGAGRLMTFWRVTLPIVAPGIGAGAVLAWARALGEFGATITFAGNSEGRTQTVPLAVYQALESGDTGGAVVLSLVLLAISFAVLVVLRDRWLGQL